MPSDRQRREAERQRLQRQLESRRERELARRKQTLIASIIGTVVVIAAIVVVIVVVANGGSDDKTPTGSQPGPTGVSSPSVGTPTPQSESPTAPTSSAPPLGKPKACATPTKTIKKGVATFDGVTVKNFADFSKQPTVAAKNTKMPKALECADLKVGTGAQATPTSNVVAQYTGFYYSNGQVFDASYKYGTSGSPFSLTQVVPGFTQGIGGTGAVTGMKVGGQRIMILPPALGYGAAGGQGIPPNSTLVFVVDLLKVK